MVAALIQGSAVVAALDSQKPEPRKPREVAYAGKTGTIYPCCEQAKRRQCVCTASWKCPVHGGWCVGSHD